MPTLVTGHAGFIGFHVVKRLLERGEDVVGMDVVNDYYDVRIKEGRLALLDQLAERTGRKYRTHRVNIADSTAVNDALRFDTFDQVIHLAAQAGVRYSLTNPQAYVESNLTGFANVLEYCRHAEVKHLTYASTSSVYGGNTRMPFSEGQDADHPLQFYAATKRANELMAHSYSHLFGLPTTGLRFFTVYGPWGRPDMALYKFTQNILAGRPIELFNNGQHTRDFTYIDDIVTGVLAASDRPARPDPAWDSNAPDPATSNAPFRVLNIGNSRPTSLADYVAELESALGLRADRVLLPLQPGDVPDTFADVARLEAQVGYRPQTPVSVGVRAFVAWFRQFHGI